MALQYQTSTANCAEVGKRPITLPSASPAATKCQEKKGRLGLLPIKLKISYNGNIKGEKTQSIGKALT